MKKNQLKKVIAKLDKEFPNAKCALDHKNAFELLIATILSAQCTDKRINMITPSLFRMFPTPEKMAKASQGEMERLIKSAGFFRQKAKSLISTSQSLVENFGGEVPSIMDDLTQLRGVARKTANVVLGDAFGISVGIVVDTHVKRISKVLGLTTQSDPAKIEKDLCKIIPEEFWIKFPHWLILHGRKTCVARRPQCLQCPILKECPRIGLKRLPMAKAKRSLSFDELTEAAVNTQA